MPNSTSPTLLSLLAVGLLAGSACTLAPPPYNQNSDAGAGAVCTAASSVDAGAVDGAPYVVVPSGPIACTGKNVTVQLSYASGYTPDPNDQATVKKMMATMSLFDKAQQMRGTAYGASGVTQMSDTQRSEDTDTIRGFHYRDASRGMNLAEDMSGVLPSAGFAPGGTTPVGYSTVFPVSMARGAAFDIDLEYAIGEAIGDEMMAANETLLLAPCMNILRHPLWGRAQETYGEDAFHIGRLASAMTVGVQQHVAANAKHFMAYDIEASRDYNNMLLDEQTLRETYGRHFRMVVQDAGVASVMASYNRVNNEKSTVNRHILTDVLRTDFGFQGFVLSDWWAMDPQVDTGKTTTYYASNAIQGVKAGLDVELPWSLNYSMLESIVQTGGGLAQTDIDAAVNRVLMQKLRFNSYDLSKGTYGLGVAKTTYVNSRIIDACHDHVDLARKAAVESMVLLKNDKQTLPINKSFSKVAVVGVTIPYKSKNNGKVTSSIVDFTKDIRTGDMGSSRAFAAPEDTIGPLDGIDKTKPSGVTVVTSKAAIDSVTAAQNISSDGNVSSADFVVVIAGLTAEDEGEDYTLASDRSSFALDAKQTDSKYANIQNTLISSVAGLGKPMVVVLEGGSIIDMPWLAQVPSVVMAWYPGQVGGEAMGMLIWGEYQGVKYNFSGKLPFTWGNLGDYPQFSGANRTTSADYYLGYRYFDINKNLAPVFPFGFGLSYTKFTYDHLQFGCTDMSEGAVLPVYVDVTNAGDFPGDEVVELFVSFPNSKAVRRTTIKELKGFARVSLAPGETKQVMIPVRLKDLDYYDQDNQVWVVEGGEISIMVGGSSTNLPLKGSVTVNGYTKSSSNY
jgi:beta-glucosidase